MKIQTQAETFAVRLAADWYHITKNELPIGTELTPRGGESAYSDSPIYHGDQAKRQDHVWVDNLENVGGWQGKHIYQVQPSKEPTLYPGSTPDDGWITPSATITREVPDEEQLAALRAQEARWAEDDD